MRDDGDVDAHGMNNVIMRKVTITANYQSLLPTKLIGSVSIACPPANTGDVFFKGDDGSDIPWVPGEWHDFEHVNLAEFQVKGTPGDVVTIVGGTW